MVDRLRWFWHVECKGDTDWIRCKAMEMLKRPWQTLFCPQSTHSLEQVFHLPFHVIKSYQTSEQCCYKFVLQTFSFCTWFCVAPCGHWDCKNRCNLFPDQTSYEATKAGFRFLSHTVNCRKFCFWRRHSVIIFLCVWNVFRTAERICAKFTWKTCLVPGLDEFEG